MSDKLDEYIYIPKECLEINKKGKYTKKKSG
jgi:hypothetical protein